MATGFPAPALREHSAGRHHPGVRLAPQLDLRRHSRPGLHEGTLHSWNVAFQRQLPFSLTADIAYVGNRGVDLVMDVDTNASLVYGSGNVGRPQFAPFNRTGTTRMRSNDNKSEYHALQMKVDRRFRNGLLLMNSYTLSRSKDLVNENTSIGTPIDFELSWARSNFDRTHNYVLTAIYELPWGPGKRWMSDSLLGKIIGGWQLSGLFIAQSGQPLNITGNGTLLNTPGNTAFANLNGSNTRARRPRTRPAVLRSDGLLAAGGGRAGQHEAQQRSGRPGLLAARHVALQAVLASAAAASPSSASTPSTRPTPCAGATPAPGYSIAAGNTFGQITGTNGGQRSLRFGGRFVF